MFVGLGWCEPHATVAHNDRRHAVGRRGSEVAVPGGLAVVMGMDIDPPWAHDLAFGIDLSMTRAFDHSHLTDLLPIDGHVGCESCASGPVDDHAVSNHQIMGHSCAPLPRTLVVAAKWMKAGVARIQS